MTRPETVFFDLGGVVADWNPRYLYDKLLTDSAEVDFFLASVCNEEWLSRLNRGDDFLRAATELSERFPRYTQAIFAYRDRWREMIRSVNPGMPDIIRAVKARNEGVYLLSNLPREMLEVTVDALPILREFDGLFISGVEGYAKPDTRAFTGALDRFGLTADRCLLIDNDALNVEVAIGLGWTALRFTRADMLADDLRELGLIG